MNINNKSRKANNNYTMRKHFLKGKDFWTIPGLVPSSKDIERRANNGVAEFRVSIASLMLEADIKLKYLCYITSDL